MYGRSGRDSSGPPRYPEEYRQGYPQNYAQTPTWSHSQGSSQRSPLQGNPRQRSSYNSTQLLGQHTEHNQSTAPQPPPPPQSKKVVYLPNRFYGIGDNALTAADRPLSSGPYAHIPYPLTDVEERFHAKLDTVCFIPLVASPEGIGGGVTETAAAIQNISPQCRCIRRCITMKAVFDYYINPVNPKSTWEQQRPLPSARAQARAIHGLHCWYQGQLIQHTVGSPVVNSHDAIADQVYRQILTPLDSLIRTRYAHLGQQRNPAGSESYPLWTRPTIATHHGTGRGRAGFPDFVLYPEYGEKKTACVVEIKTWDAFNENGFEEFFTTFVSDWQTGQFRWKPKNDVSSDSEKIIRQLWGQLIFYECRAGFLTNGQQILMFVRTDKAELTFSEIYQWDDCDLLETLFGLCCFSIDGFGHPEGRDNVIISAFPKVSRESNWVI